ncbi:MAG: flagellar biosynthesis anti-sigma factor FlgM [Deltaproteobacteria bacterium]|nr:flagellar biosynthesis anti-sigma factor FlgM [Deltaproteobacteria bacterium]
MKISGRKGSELKNVAFKKTGGVQGAQSSSSARTNRGVGGAGESTVAISDRARQVSDAHRALDALPDIRVGKVGEIQSALDRGNYHVEGEKVADKMVTDAVREIRNRTR